MKKPVLGLFADEAGLRDYLAGNLSLIEPGLRLKKTNYGVHNPLGADGSFDIFAQDRFGNFVIIEIKRSDQAARHALHELSKYIALFMESQKVDIHRIRCFVISTHWHELDVPLSFFKDSCPVEVSGFEVAAAGRNVTVKKRPLPKVSLASRLSPDMRFIFFESAENQKGFCEDLRQALAGIRHARAALIVMEPIADRDYMCLLCAWRVPDIALTDVKTLIFNPDFQEEYYFFPGWELETDLCDWLEDQSKKATAVWPSDARATPEKVENYKAHHRYTELIKLGDWPENDLVNDLEQVVQFLGAKDVSSKTSRANRHEFEKLSSKSTGKSWDYASDAFEQFISNNAFWVSMYKQVARDIPEDATVHFIGSNMRHFYYAVHQAIEYPEAELSAFAISISDENGLHVDVVGGWLWDGVTYPANARANIEGTYGTTVALSLLLQSAVDQKNYDAVYRQHGFFPYVSVRHPDTGEYKLYGPDDAPTHGSESQRLSAFVKANPDYCAEVSACLEAVPRNFAKIK